MVHAIVACTLHDMSRYMVAENLVFHLNNGVKISMLLVNMVVYVWVSVCCHQTPPSVGGADSTLTSPWVVYTTVTLCIRGCMPADISSDTTLVTAVLASAVVAVSGCSLPRVPFELYVRTSLLSTTSRLLLETWGPIVHGTPRKRVPCARGWVWVISIVVVFLCFYMFQPCVQYPDSMSCSLLLLVGAYQVCDVMHRALSAVGGLHISVTISRCIWEECGNGQCV